jgi:hypothetical protein
MNDSLTVMAGPSSAIKKPMAIPGREIKSGIIRWSRSMKAITIKAAENMKKAKKVRERLNFEKRVKAIPPVKASTKG